MKSIFLSLLVLISVAVAGDSVGPDFSNYPKSAGFREFVKGHLSGDFRHHRVFSTNDLPDPLRLAISCNFRGKDGTAAAMYFVTRTGRAVTSFEIYNYGSQATEAAELTFEQHARLKDVIAHLPKKNAYPPLDQLIIVSFREDETWVTRTYRPEDVRALFAILADHFSRARQSQ